MPRPTLTQAEIGADVIATLAFHEVLTGSSLQKAMGLTGIDKDQLQQAVNRRRGAQWAALKLTDSPTAKPYSAPSPTGQRRSAGSRTTAPTPTRKRPPTNQRRQQQGPTGLELWCSGSEEEPEGHFAPEDHFLVRSDRPHLRVSKCDEHRHAYQAARVVKVAAREAIGEIGIQIRLDPESNLIGLACKECGQPLKAGETIEGDAQVRHELCPTGGLKLSYDSLFAAAGRPKSRELLAEMVGVTRRTIERWVTDGVPYRAADEAASALGTTPSAIWENWK